MKKNVKKRTKTLVELAMLSAVILLLTLTPLGYLPTIGPFKITIMMIPVAIGAMTMGPSAGLFLGGIFGLSSFMTCLGINPDTLGPILFGVNPFLTAILCFAPRLLMGFLCGLLFRGLNRRFPDKTWIYTVCSAFSALCNTILFMSILFLLFLPTLLSMAENVGKTLFAFIISGTLVNCLGEIAVSVLIGTPVAKAVCRYRNRDK